MNAIRFLGLVGVSALILLCGCGPGDPASVMRRFTPPEDEAIATNYIAQLRAGKFDLIQKDIDPSLKDTFTSDLWGKMAAVIPKQDPLSVKVIGARSFRDSDRYEINLGFEYQFPTNWIVINVATRKKGGATTIIGFHVYRCSDSLENINKFTLKNKGPAQYGMLALAVAVPIFISCALVICLCTKMTGKKWLWVILILIGAGKISVNWTTGAMGFSLIFIQLFGASAVAQPYTAWIVSVSVPVGAIVFLLKRRSLMEPVGKGTDDLNLQIDPHQRR